MNDNIHILGAGSIGLLLAARLAPVMTTTLIRRPGDYPEQLSLTLEENGIRQHSYISQTASDKLLQPVNCLVVCTKAYDALPALKSLATCLTKETAILLMQNGMSSQEEIIDSFPHVSIYAASSTEGAYRAENNRVVHAGRGITRIGRLQGKEQDWVGIFHAAGLASKAVESIRWHLANKLRVNALINPLTVLFDCLNGELLERPEAINTMQGLGGEVDTILAAAGYLFPTTAFEQAREVAQQTASNVSSMLQDARAGRRLEIEAITGYLLQLADLHGVEALGNLTVYKELSNTQRRISK